MLRESRGNIMNKVILCWLIAKNAGLGIMLFVAFVITDIFLPTPAKAQRRIIRTVEPDYLHAVIGEGIGFDEVILGSPDCNKTFVKSRLGEPEKEKSSWLSYKNKYGLDFSFTPDGILSEIIIRSPFKGELTSGISMFSKKQDVFETYGVPVSQKTVHDLDKDLEDLVLYKKWELFGKPKESKIFYRRKGLLFWFKADDILQIVVRQKQSQDSTAYGNREEGLLEIEKVEKEESREGAIESIVEFTDKAVIRTQNFNVPFPEGAKLVLKNTNGSLKISGQKTDQCRIKADTRVFMRDEDKAGRLLKRVLVHVRPSDKIVWVEVERAEELVGNRLIKVDFEITLPQKADLKLNTSNGSVGIAGVTGDINCEIGNGIITAEEIAGSARLGINFGEIMVKKADFDKSLITANNGPVTCEDISGNIQVKVNSGEVNVRYAETAPSVCDVSISANNGDIDFTGPVDFSAMAEAKTMVGAIETDLPLTDQRSGGSKMSGKIGEGEGKLQLRTTIGSIKINSNIGQTKIRSSGDSQQSGVPAEVIQRQNK
ncbi:MAG: DUF4097 family beta strand repeat protein [Planctomycetota bacterium]|nr:MAG: DUF4097 family beta strand repeat protein [Planctomycetota bacterium]